VDDERAERRPYRISDPADVPRPNHAVPGGLLGADYTVENGRYVSRSLRRLNWTPQLRAPSELAST